MNLQAMRSFVDPLLYRTILWLTDKKAYEEADDGNTLDAACLSIACDIMTQATSVLSPKHLGLAVHLHHQFGSRKLIEDLHALGSCMSYSELRCFLTSEATYITTKQRITPAGAIVPPDIVPKRRGGRQVVAAGDNWDHNERTIDGKRTTHAMTSILISPEAGVERIYPRIPHQSKRTLDLQCIPGNDNAIVLDSIYTRGMCIHTVTTQLKCFALWLIRI